MRKYTIEDIEKCVENWGLCKVEKEHIEKFLQKQALIDLMKLDEQRICKKCGTHVSNEEEYKLFCGCSGCASTLD